MDPVLRLTKEQEVVIEGYLHKKTTGIDNLLNPKKQEGGWKKRYFILLRSKMHLSQDKKIVGPEFIIVFYSKEPKKVTNLKRSKNRKSLSLSKRGGLRQDSQTNVRSFQGVVQNAKQKVSSAIQIGQKMVRKSGKIVLSAGNQVYLEHNNTIRLQTFEHTILLRVDRDKPKSEIPIIAGQWLQALRQSLALASADVVSTNYDKKKAFTFFSPTVSGEKHKSGGLVALPQEISQVLQNRVLRDEFYEYLRLVQASENLEFYEEAQKFMKQTQALYRRRPAPRNREFEIRKQGKTIFERFISEKSPMAVNLSSACRQEVIRHFAENKKNKDYGVKTGDSEPKGIYSSELFLTAQNEIFLLMEANFFHGFYKDLSKRTGCFSNLVYRYELTGYDAVFTTHFGSVKTESDRLIKRFEGRLETVKLMIKSLDEETKNSKEVAVKEFVSLSDSLSALYALNDQKLSRLLTLKDVLEKQVNFLKNSQNMVKESLMKIHKIDEAKLKKYNKNNRDVVREARSKAKRSAGYTDYQKKMITLEELAVIYNQPELTEANLETERACLDLKHQKKVVRLAKDRDMLKGELTLSLDQLETVDLRRIAAQQQICKLILRAEHNFIVGCEHDLEVFSQTNRAIDSSYDTKAFAGQVISAPNEHGVIS